MKPENLTRYGADVGGRCMTYKAILAKYVCDACGGALVHSFVREGEETVDRISCGTCGGQEIISEYTFDRQVSDGYEVEQMLPPALRETERNRTCQSATEAADDLFG